MAEVTEPPEDSILNATKLMVNVPKALKVFDEVLIMHINTVFSTLQQLGVGPVGGYFITNENQGWSLYTIDDNSMNMVKSLMGMRVRLYFDPPTTSFGIKAYEDLCNQLEWRLNFFAESVDAPDNPSYPPVP